MSLKMKQAWRRMDPRDHVTEQGEKFGHRVRPREMPGDEDRIVLYQ